jgi:UDP-GlcNAc:undecaprenyl-phosphate GlcNAc-1-phosphate transferase
MIKLEYVIILLLATIFLIIFIKNRDKIGSFLHVLDVPAESKIHKKITPLIGSFPILVLSFIILIYLSFTNQNQDTIYILIYSYLFFIMGYLDDRFKLNAYLKLFTSIIIILVAVNSFEFFIIDKIYIQTFNKIVFLSQFRLFFTVLCILLLINALNLLDGINGLASGFATAWMFFLALVSSNEQIIELFFILSIFNLINTFQIIKGKYFLGDSGTLFLGCMIALSTIYIYNKQLIEGELIDVEKIFIFFMIPGIDMFRLFLSRLKKKKDPFSRDLNHLHHIMLNKYSLKKTLIIYLLLFLSSNLLSYFNIIDAWLIIIMYLTIYIFFIFFYKKKFEKTS